MSKTIQQLMMEDWELGSTSTKVASQADSSEIHSQIDKLAAELGFNFKTASDDEDDKKDESKKDDDASKEASGDAVAEEKKEDEKKDDDKDSNKEAAMALDKLYENLFPEDVSLGKTASEIQKEATNEAIGARAFELMNTRFDNRITKIASEMAGSSLKSTSGTQKGLGDKPADTAAHLANDADAKDMNAIGTQSKENGIDETNKAERGAAASGNFEGDKLAQAYRKLMLKQAMEANK